MSKRFKKGKKDDLINVEEKLGHLYLGDKDLRLLMLRPREIIEFSEFAGGNSEDILLWVGKTLAKHFIEKLFPGENWENENLTIKKEVILSVLETFENLGYGSITALFLRDKILIAVETPISENERENIMAKNICVLYQGIFNGMFEQIGLEADNEEVQCYLKDNDSCIFKIDLLVDEFNATDIDAEVKSKPIASFLEKYNV